MELQSKYIKNASRGIRLKKRRRLCSLSSSEKAKNKKERTRERGEMAFLEGKDQNNKDLKEMRKEGRKGSDSLQEGISKERHGNRHKRRISMRRNTQEKEKRITKREEDWDFLYLEEKKDFRYCDVLYPVLLH
jgi:hypothetical protein